MEQARPISRRERNKIATRERILQAAKELFAARGVAATTADDLAAHADVSRTTFFNYFPNWDAVLDALCSDQLDNLTLLIDGLLARPLPTRDRLRGLCDGVLLATEQRPGYLKVMSAEFDRDLADKEISAARTERFNAQLLRLVDAGRAQGDVRTDHDPVFLAQMVAAVFTSVLRSWRLIPGYDLPTGFTGAATFLSDALAPRLAPSP